MNDRRINEEFKASQVGQLTKRHEQLAQSRQEQASIPYTGLSYAEEQQLRRTQSSNQSTNKS